MKSYQMDRLIEETIRTNNIMAELLVVLKKIEEKVGPSDNPFKTYGTITPLGSFSGDSKRG